MTWGRAAVAVLVALLAGAAVGWRLRGPPPAPRVEVREVVKTQIEYRDRDVVREVAGPVRVVERWRQASGPTPVEPPGCLPCPTCEEHVRIEERGPVVTEATHEAAGASQTQKQSEVVVVPPPPAPRPSWALSGGAVLTSRGVQPVGGFGHRLAGPVWLEAWAAPTASAVGVELRVEF